MLGTPRIYVHPVIHFLMRFLFLVNLSCPAKTWLPFSFIEYKVTAGAQQRGRFCYGSTVSLRCCTGDYQSSPCAIIRFVTYRMNSILHIRASSSPMFGVLSLFIRVGNPFVI